MKPQTNRILSGASLLRHGAGCGSSLRSVERMKRGESPLFYHEQLRSQELSWEILMAITSPFGQVRLGKVRDFIPVVHQDQLEFLQEIYLKWVSQDEWMLLKGTYFETGEQQHLAVKCSKRGNDVFNRRLDQKLGFLSRLGLKKKDFFSLEDFKPHKRVMAQLLWFTLTYDSNRCSLHESWINVSEEFNLFMTNLRNKYGKIQVLKFIQGFPGQGPARGYPHFHAILLFEEANFQVFPHWESREDGSEELAFRIHEKDELADQGKWHSWVDVKALKSMSSAVNYCRKYGQGTYDVVSEEGQVNEEALMNCSMNWLYRKQTYSLSSRFHEALSDLIEHLQGSKVFQARLDGSEAIPLWSWEFLGVRSHEELEKCGLDPPGWTLEVEDPNVWEKLVRREYQRERWDDD
jgi:hypothetical protein